MQAALRRAGLEFAQPIKPCPQILNGRRAALKEQHDETRDLGSGSLIHDAMLKTVAVESL